MANKKQNNIATGISYGGLPSPDHARDAVNKALKKAKLKSAASVLLFLTCGYASNPKTALKEAAKAASTTQVIGCSAMGLLSDEEWLIDSEGAVAMVFPADFCLQPARLLKKPELLLSLVTPSSAMFGINQVDIKQIGAISTDEYGHGPYSIWQTSREVKKGYIHVGFENKIDYAVGVAQGVRQISPLMEITKGEKHTLLTLNNEPALKNLRDSLPENLHGIFCKQPHNILCAISENEDVESINQGHYKLQHIVSLEEEKNTIHISGTVHEKRHIFWALRDEAKAQEEMQNAIDAAKKSLAKKPKFAFVFPNISRGPEFYGGYDKDIDMLKAAFPDMPIIGFYGNGEIAPGHKLSALMHHYSTVFTLFA